MKTKIFIFTVLCILLTVTVLSCNTTGERPAPFTVNLNSPQIPVGEIEIQFDTFMSIAGLRKLNVDVIYFPREDAVALRYRMDFTTYHQCWNREGRLAFLTALARYNEDFNERNLDARNNRRSMRTYGKTRGFLIWQQFAFAVRAHGNMDINMGYAFKDRRPYFSIIQGEANFTNENTNDNRSSVAVPMFFTRAQAAQLAEFFEQSFLNSLSPVPGTSNVDVFDDEEYFESPRLPSASDADEY